MQQAIHYELLQQKDRQTATFMHDVDKLLLPLVEMIESKQISGDLAQLVGNLKNTITKIKSSIKFKTGSDFVDANLQYLMHKYKTESVRIKIEGILPNNHRMRVTDVVSLFSNLLENAFEAVVKTSDHKVIEMNISANKTSLYIRIKNNYDGKLQPKGVGFETTKIDKRNHGIGFQSVQSIVEKYSGHMKVSTENNEFVVEITFPSTIYKNQVL
jgi:sensor histidine kinase regulating citrate/malate metabolism